MYDLLFFSALLVAGFLWLRRRSPLQGRLAPLAFLALGFASLAASALVERREFPARIHHLAMLSPSENYGLKLGGKVSSLAGEETPDLRRLFASALRNQGEYVPLRLEDSEARYPIGYVYRFSFRQTDSDLSYLLYGLEFFPQRPVLLQEPHSFLRSQMEDLQPGVPFLGIRERKLETKRDLKRALEELGTNAMFSLRVLVNSQERELIGNFLNVRFSESFSLDYSKLQHVGAVDWGITLVQYPEFLNNRSPVQGQRVLLLQRNGNTLFPSFSANRLGAGDTLGVFLPFSGLQQTTLTVPQVETLRSQKLVARPELAIPFAYYESGHPLTAAALEIAARANRLISPEAYQITTLREAWDYLPKRAYELPELRWKSFSYWLAQWGVICLLGALYFFPLQYWPEAGCHPRLLEAAFLLFSMAYLLHELFVVRVWQ